MAGKPKITPLDYINAILNSKDGTCRDNDMFESCSTCYFRKPTKNAIFCRLNGGMSIEEIRQILKKERNEYIQAQEKLTWLENL